MNVQCPHAWDLSLKVELLSSLPLTVAEIGLAQGDEGLHVTFESFSDPGAVAGDQPVPASRYAVWTPSRGWLAFTNHHSDSGRLWSRFPLAGPPVCAPLGLMLGSFALCGRNPSPAVAGWLADIFSDLAGVILSLQVMET